VRKIIHRDMDAFYASVEQHDDPFVWALVHGTAMLFINGQLPEPAQRGALEPYIAERIYVSIRQSPS
jgi:hypothetical protein